MPEPTCVDEPDLRAFLRHELPEAVRDVISAHLKVCPRCATLARRLETDSERAATVTLPDKGEPTGPDPAPPAAPRPRCLAGYEVLDELGRGGMSVVYRARQAQPDRLVALKMLLAGSHADAVRRARLLAEADAIARLRHPHVVQIYEVGEHDGLPFLALEYVAGGSLAQKLGGTPQPPRDAAGLVEVLARAVQHAHEQGIIHRDLKPANILLQIADCRFKIADLEFKSAILNLQSAIPKITDFGVAKILADGRDLTQSHAILGTPSYMAPEQAAGRTEDVGPLCDVYALGAILYECLTGRPPFKAATPLETLAQVTAAEPASPRQLQPAVPRDLETICLQCLRKEPHRRYPSGRALADDLRRFLDGQPVLARPVGRAERVAKWARRRPLAAALVGLGVTAVLALLAVWTALTMQIRAERDRAAAAAGEAARQQRRAAANQEKALAAVDRFLTRIGERRLAAVPGLEDLRRELLEEALEFHQGFVADNDNPDPQARRDLGRAYHRLGRIYHALGRFDDEEQAYLQAVAIQQRLAEEEPDNPEPRADLAKSYNNLVILYTGPGGRKTNMARAEEALRHALDLKEGLVRDHSDNPDYRVSLAKSLIAQSQLRRQSGRSDLADAPLARAVGLLEGVAPDRGSPPAYREALAEAVNSAGILYLTTSRAEAAVAAFRRTLGLYRELAQADPRVRRYREMLASTSINLGAACAALRQDAEAVAAYGEAAKLWRQFTRESPGLPYYANGLGMTLLNLGLFQLERDRYGEARTLLEEAAATFRTLLARQPTKFEYRRDLAKALFNLGAVAHEQRRWDEALARMQEARPLIDALAAGRPNAPEIIELRAIAAAQRGLTLRMLGRDAEALPCLDEEMDRAVRAFERDPRLAALRRAVRQLSWMRGDLYAARGRPEAALADWERAARAEGNGGRPTPQTEQFLESVRLAVRGEHARAVVAVDALAKDTEGDLTFRLACVYLYAAAAVGRSTTLGAAERARLSADYHRRAVALLERAEKQEAYPFPARQRLTTDPVYAPLRDRADFQKLCVT